MKKSIVLCADDYGQVPAISQGIISLIKQSRLSAASCMVNASWWSEHAVWLAPYQGKINIGLHFNLTEGMALSSEYQQAYGAAFMPLSRLLWKAALRKLDRKIIEAECHAQIDRFEHALGFLPVFLDGHQHIHQFPVIREAVINVYRQRLEARNTYIRLVTVRFRLGDVIGNVKKIIIHVAGTQAFRELLEKHKIKYNQTFNGIYSFAHANRYPLLFPRFLAEIGDRGIIMCHPGLESPQTDDLIADARYAEYQYLAGERFVMDCERAGVRLSTM
jgi:predicted glycoside hydrolase/deacetylase ChbG (UPF0249 family)